MKSHVELYTTAQLLPLPLASVKSRLVLPFWYRPIWVVPDIGPLNGCVCVCISLLIYLGSVTDQEPDKTNKEDKKFVQKDLAAKGQINTIK